MMMPSMSMMPSMMNRCGDGHVDDERFYVDDERFYVYDDAFYVDDAFYDEPMW